MAVPSRPAQIKRVAEFLDWSVDNERTVEQTATQIVDSIYDMWAVDVHDAPQPPKVGMAFKTPALASKVYHVAWIGEEFEGGPLVCWVIDASTDYGTLVPYDSNFWRILTPSNAKAGAGGDNKDGWKVGDKLSLMQRARTYTILAVGDKTVLLRDAQSGTLQADSNACLKRYYKKER